MLSKCLNAGLRDEDLAGASTKCVQNMLKAFRAIKLLLRRLEEKKMGTDGNPFHTETPGNKLSSY